MSKRLNKRQARLEEEQAQLRALQSAAEEKPAAVNDAASGGEEEEQQEEEQEKAAPVNAFAALKEWKDGGDDDDDDEEDADADDVPDTPKKKNSNKKKKKKKKALPTDLDNGSTGPQSSSTSTPGGGGRPGGKTGKSGKKEMTMDEVDLALQEMKKMFPDLARPSSSAALTPSQTAESSSTLSAAFALRNLLAVETKNLDAEAELRKFFGSRVVASATLSSSNKRQGNLLKTNLAKPCPHWPPPNSFLGLGMRELTEQEVADKRARMGRLGVKAGPGAGERYWTFEHGGAYREAQRQFLGAISSHDPNQLFALLQVFPYHTDTILQMGEVYRQQSDLSQASEYIDRALFAFERAFAPGFNITSGNARLDFDRVENRGFYLALIRNLQFLGRRGCWTTSFTFAKLLLEMDPHSDPQGALLWLDFLAVKSGNSAWLLSLLSTWDAAITELGWKEASAGERERIALWALPGLGWAKALALRAEENARKDKEHEASNKALREAVLTFPWVLPLLADKVGFSLSTDARAHPLLQLQLGYESGPLSTMHLLSHIYVQRSQALWKEAATLSWLQSQLPSILPDLLTQDGPSSYAPREKVLQHFKEGTPESIARHVMVSEDNSTLLGFLDRRITGQMGMSFDPLPPSRSVSMYDNNYFMGLSSRRRTNRNERRRGSDEEDDNEEAGFLQAIVNSLMQWGGGGAEMGAGAVPGNDEQGVLAALGRRLREAFGAGGDATDEDRDMMMAQVLALAEQTRDGGRIPGALPGQDGTGLDGEEDEVWEDDEDAAEGEDRHD